MTDSVSVLKDVIEWKNRPLELMYPVVFFVWIDQNEGAKFLFGVMNELHHRGLKDILVAVIDGLKGSPEAICAYLGCEIQTCIVHLICSPSVVGKIAS